MQNVVYMVGWVPGHAGVEGNERADQAQKRETGDMSSASQQLWQFTSQTWCREFQNTAQSKPTGTANWYLKCYRTNTQHKDTSWSFETSTQSNPPTEAQQTQLHSFLPSTCWPDWISIPNLSNCGNGDKTAEHLLMLCPKLAAECQRYFGNSTDITDVFQDYESLVEFLISSGHLSPI